LTDAQFQPIEVDPELLAEEERRVNGSRVGHVALVNMGSDGQPDVGAVAISELAVDDAADLVIVPAPGASPLALTAPTTEEIDSLWDWVRRDLRDGDGPILPYAVTTSVALHARVAEIGIVYAIQWHGEHVGFVALDPIYFETEALVHLYLTRTARGAGLQIARHLLTEAEVRHPDLHLSVVTEDPRICRFARRAGFPHMRYVLTRKAP